MNFHFINMVGLEVEGAWNKERQDLIPDAGIKADEFKNSVCCGELVSKPFKTYEECESFLKDNWPTETNSMSGYHIHLSFKDIASYVAYMSKDFHKYFLDKMLLLGTSYPIQNEHFWERLEDRNKFCKNRFVPHEQIFLAKKIPNDHGRYTQLHFGYNLHRTIEVRLFPTFISVETAIAALKATIECFESYLELNPPAPFNINEQFLLEVEDEQVEQEEKTSGVIRPFNYFMAKGIVREEKYGLKELYKDKDVKEAAPPKYKFKNAKVNANGEYLYGQVIYNNDDFIPYNPEVKVDEIF